MDKAPLKAFLKSTAIEKQAKVRSLLSVSNLAHLSADRMRHVWTDLKIAQQAEWWALHLEGQEVTEKTMARIYTEVLAEVEAMSRCSQDAEQNLSTICGLMTFRRMLIARFDDNGQPR